MADNLTEKRPQGVTLRTMVPDDIPRVHEIEQQLFPLDAWPADMFLTEITHPTRTYLVAVRGEEIVGYAGVMLAADTADIQTIAVLPEYRGKGLGRTLLGSLHRQVAEGGASRILLEVRADNLRAQNLYRLNGYTHIHTRKRYYRDGADALVMQKTLKGEKE